MEDTVQFLKFVGATFLIGTAIVGLLFYWAAVTHDDNRRRDTRYAEQVQMNAIREHGHQEMIRLSRLIDTKRAEIDSHDLYIEAMGTGNYDMTKAALNKSLTLSNDLYDLTQQYDGVAEDLGCSYPASITFTLPNGDRVTLPCYL